MPKPPKVFLPEEHNNLKYLYLDEQLSANQIAKRLNRDQTTITRWLILSQIPLRSKKDEMKLRDNLTIKNNILKHGVLSTNSLDSTKEAKRQKCLQKYGVDNIFKTKELKERRIEVLGKWTTDDMVEKARQTSFERYGAYYTQTKEGYERSFKLSFRHKKYTLPSGRIIHVQGYEPQILTHLLKHITEDELCVDIKNKPCIPYIYNGNRKYFPDIFIPRVNKIIEVKSLYTIYSDKEKNKAKQAACLALGYKHEFFIYDNVKNIIIENYLLN